MIQKKDIIVKMKNKGLFWSYDVSVEAETVNDAVLIEHILKYGDIDDLRSAIELYGKDKLHEIWQRYIKNDLRFIKLSVFLGRVVFNLDIESDDIKRAINERGFILRNFNV